MKIEQAISQLRHEVNDRTLRYTTEECLSYLNTAVQMVCAQLAAWHAPLLVQEATLRDGDALPHNFLCTAGTYPVAVTGGRAVFLTGEPELTFRYYAGCEQMEDWRGELPFSHDAINQVVIKTAELLATNTDEFDLSQDRALLDELRAALQQTMSG